MSIMEVGRPKSTSNRTAVRWTPRTGLITGSCTSPNLINSFLAGRFPFLVPRAASKDGFWCRTLMDPYGGHNEVPTKNAKPGACTGLYDHLSLDSHGHPCG